MREERIFLIRNLQGVYNSKKHVAFQRKGFESMAEINTSNIKNEFFKYIDLRKSLDNSKYQKSYKLVLLMALLALADDEGKAEYEAVCKTIYKMYMDRYEAGLKVEQSDSRIQKEISVLSINIIKSVMDENAYKVINEKGYIFKRQIGEEEYLCFNTQLWNEFSEKELVELKNVLKEKLAMYYRERVDRISSSTEFKSYLEEIVANYLNARNQESFAGHKLGTLFRTTIPNYFQNLPFIDGDKYQITGSIGQGNWAKVPWIALMHKDITTSTQRGIYIVYLFSEDMTRLYLTLMQGVTDLKNLYGRSGAMDQLRLNAQMIREKVKMEAVSLDDKILISENSLGEMYQAGTIGYIEYDSSNIPEDRVLIENLETMVCFYQDYIYGTKEKKDMNDQLEYPKNNSIQYIEFIYNYIRACGFTYDINTIKNFYLSLKTKPFVLLAGISGTGKSKLVELFAAALGATSENGRFTIIPVRPDWSDPSDLVGYKNIEGTFLPGPMATVIRRAMDNPTMPHFICLDEMNLARVEYYFSDILSIMETRKRKDGIKTDKLIKDEVFGADHEARKFYGDIYMPDNLYIVGTVNMDETTFPFSKKVLDRANTIEFNQVDLAVNFNYFNDSTDNKSITLDNGILASRYIKIADCIEHQELIEKIIFNLEIINRILEKTGQHFGYRVRDEVTFYVLYAVNEELMNFDKAIDYSIVQKILPRIQGSSLNIKEILVELFVIFIQNNNLDYNYIDNDNWEKMGKYLLENQVKYPLSAKKVAKMIRRYEVDGFTTFWE